jgi:PHD/YefM family antitoxin component YafN of YafNO toxin-antitoxin module
MEKFTVQEFQADFDNLIERVEKGESLSIITSEYGNAVMIPYGEYKEVDDTNPKTTELTKKVRNFLGI